MYRMTVTVFLVLATFALAWAATRAAIQWALRRNLLDHPNHRSSHVRATPRGGGVAIVLAFYAGAIALWLADALPGRMLAALACGLPVAIVGYIDDAVTLSARVRLLVQAASAAALLWVAAPLPALQLGGYTIAPAVAVGLYLLAIIWLTNLYNFMDGIDGIAAGQAIAAGVSWALLAPALGAVGGVLAAAAAGFLRYNWPPARIFMGDVGSGFCGFIVAAIALLGAGATATPPLWWLIPLAPFICDASMTLLIRTLRGKTPGVAHRSHAYQHLARRWRAHLPVTLAYTAVALLYAGACFGWAAGAPAERGNLAFLACVLPLCVVAALLRAGQDDA